MYVIFSFSVKIIYFIVIVIYFVMILDFMYIYIYLWLEFRNNEINNLKKIIIIYNILLIIF